MTTEFKAAIRNTRRRRNDIKLATEATGLNLKETLGIINHEQGIQTNQWYALNYPIYPPAMMLKRV